MTTELVFPKIKEKQFVLYNITEEQAKDYHVEGSRIAEAIVINCIVSEGSGTLDLFVFPENAPSKFRVNGAQYNLHLDEEGNQIFGSKEFKTGTWKEK